MHTASENTTDTEGYFPIKVEYQNGQVAVVQHPDHIAKGVGFRVLETNASSYTMEENMDNETV